MNETINGVVIGVVIDNKDPDGLGRVKVVLPGLADDEIGHWARISTLMAGAERGSFFLPEIDDEVVLAFENGNIKRPYRLGALWNGSDLPPADNADGQNNLRFIKSRSGHLIQLDDTSGTEKIEIIDSSGNNMLTIDSASNTITISSSKDINIEAPQGKIVLNAQSVEVTSSADTKLKAQGGLELDGSPGNTDVKGSLINLN